ncbi:hypothetical protein GHT09_010995 [Marmota monax]|uniref:Neurotransmitter-gated ion-channel ligand-binding domain-containing protein n=1 Tax=Marmota monax TaxID=9995 RepID=A0A834V1C3_MARMO|nr:hypothetical protein GHT09_010995 [Marmota monax]
MMSLWILLHLAFLGLSSIPSWVQGSSLSWPSSLDLNSPLEVHETIQIPNNGSAPLQVNVQVFVSNVFNVDILRYTVSSMMMLRLSWLDAGLAWNASARSRHAVTLPCESLWTPGLTIREAPEAFLVAIPHLVLPVPNVVPRSLPVQEEAGPLSVHLSPQALETNCDFELLHFPRDKSDCSLSFFAFSNTGAVRVGTGGEGRGEGTLTSSTVRELEFRAHAVNEIVSVKREYVVCDLKTQVLPLQVVPCFQVTLSLKNTALKSIIALLVPGEALLLADVCGGLLPLQAMERIAYKVTLLLGYLVFHSSLVTTETVLLAGLLARDSLGDKSSPSPGPRREQRKENLGPNSEGGQALRPLLESADPSGGRRSRRSWAEAADHTFFLVYVTSVVCIQLIFAGTWIWATCKSDPAPGKAVPHGGPPRL